LLLSASWNATMHVLPASPAGCAFGAKHPGMPPSAVMTQKQSPAAGIQGKQAPAPRSGKQLAGPAHDALSGCPSQQAATLGKHDPLLKS
jgi:hypothetical protein